MRHQADLLFFHRETRPPESGSEVRTAQRVLSEMPGYRPPGVVSVTVANIPGRRRRSAFSEIMLRTVTVHGLRIQDRVDERDLSREHLAG